MREEKKARKRLEQTKTLFVFFYFIVGFIFFSSLILF